MAIKVAINGFGRIGRQVTKALFENYRGKFDLVAVNDLSDTATNAHLFKYDSNYGTFPGKVEVVDGDLVIDGDRIKVLAEKDPSKLPWADMGVDIVVESTGIFTSREKAELHIHAGAKKVIISAPAKGEDLTIVLGVNEDKYDPAKHHIVSNASCTTNCLAPAAKVLNDLAGIQQALMTTVHAYTNDQRILDLVHKDLRRARAAALSIIPTTTGAAKAVALVIPELKGKFDGYALRVPTPTVSVVDFVATVEKEITKDELFAAFDAAAAGPMKGILQVVREPLVSVDFKGSPYSSSVDYEFTNVYGKMVKVVTWYDNEWGYSMRVADLINYMAEKGL
ncbi:MULTISPECIES: type I glyceraldehyde-3-phosphate dehydrogenase [Caldilinea]|jgi:glyceraldehyde 3-phosphate dehydrogenase|uniref:Glyceraldehyde-3-phosphate dehydrogenase n=1 Tax=Caldilinea aerophila (strain DSM 14535 / JCM 11387 / NBRC 104270 / STL-6-O1) TaxID=926550 RepID=I0HZH0_CALAS|nr:MULTISPECIES: type I glyceraldehyde-3-phosphate dehydrogenase [Caldilinea]MBO9391396.1 type I glyceraldehyde-3-phosphate dehydrogenase [Caldilinea sp.]BAL98407.1 glyceraldehyde 3-phosphate dehydrogenase [Caldilinea aerophila DSM 14535 = NBRC 104270]GIV75009.1 MAG: glyceraldehyde-3-phosphate dehydrogenase [Caldilinea sp.]